MRICFVLSSAWIGGFHTFTLNLGRQFQRDGHDVSALIVARGAASENLGNVESLRREMHVHLCNRKRVLSRSRFIGQVIEAIESLRPDVLLLNHTLWAQAALPYLDEQIKRILVVHGVAHEEVEQPRGNSEWWDAVVAVGPVLYERLREEWPADRVRLIPVGVPEPRVHIRMSFEDQPLRICYAGRLDQSQKNVLLIPRIAACLVKKGIAFRWTIIGDGHDRFWLEASIAQLGLAGYFQFAGACDQGQVESLMSQHHLLVLPSFGESIGHVLQEAQMLGVVPVATRLPGATDFVVTDRQDGRLCRSDNAEDFANAIAAIDRDRAQLMQMSENGRASVRSRFDIRLIAQQYHHLFESVAEARSFRRAHAKRSLLGFRQVPRSLMPPRWLTTARVAKQMIFGGA